jgi:acyl transferase domain-containing protein
MLTKLDTPSSGNQSEPISIVGVGCRLPGNVSTLADLRSALREGRDCVTEVPPERWDVEKFYDPDPLTPGKSYVRHGGFVSDVERFDAAFFGISDSEAARMDPQQRILLETVWHMLEDAGQSPDSLAKSNTGVFVAMMNTNTYAGLKSAFESLEGTTGYDTMADAMSIAAGRIAHMLDLQGPCFALDTACSGSMVALHQARQAILLGECDSAIVAGVNIILNPGVHIAFSKVGLMSRSGRCRAFDESADGYIRSEGCMAVLLRRQSVALARGDRILANVLGTALTQDGRTPAVTAPNGQMQEKVIRLALARVGINPNEIGYVEAHGTGTPVGDPIEMSALVNVYGPGRSDQQPLYVGSAKSNFGHAESSAGLIGLVKAALSVEQGIIYPSLHYKQMNPNIDLRQAPVRVPTAPVPWPRGEQPRVAGVNSFGFSGTNAHAILQEPPAPADVSAEAVARPYEIVVLSAKSAPSLQDLAEKWTEYLDGGSEERLGDIAFTAATGRSQMRHRLAVVARDKGELGDKLHSWREGRLSRGVFAGQSPVGRKPKIGFVFTGQGAQYAGMGKQLYELEPRFKAAIDRCAALMDKDLGAPLVDVMFGPDAAKFLNDTRYVQPSLFAIEYALADLLRHWGVEPNYVIGHSVGEITAACIAGVLTLEGAVRFVLARGRLMGQLPRGGKMLAIDATPEQAREWLAGLEAEASIAGVNGPNSIVVSGTAAAVDEVGKKATAAGRRSKQLEVSHAFHSPLMDPILGELDQVAASMRVTTGSVPVVSNVSGDFLGDAPPATYWSAHVRQPVLFYQGVSKMIEAGCTVLVEIGPHPALTPAISAAFGVKKARCIPSLTRGQQDASQIFETLGALYTSGAPVNLDRAFWSPDYRRIALPLYPFRRDKHWLCEDLGLDPRSERGQEANRQVHPVLGRAASIGSRRAIFEATVAAKQPWVDHRIFGSTVFPGTGYLEMAARGFVTSKGSEWQPVNLRTVLFERPLVLGYGKPKKVKLELQAQASNGSSAESTFTISSTEDGKSETYCRGRATVGGGRVEQIDLQAELARIKSIVPVGQFYGEARKVGFEYGGTFSTVRELWMGPEGSGEAMARLTASPNADTPEDHPFRFATMFDGALQTIRAAVASLGEMSGDGTFVPRAIRSVTFARELPFQMWSHVTARAGDDRSILATARLYNDAGELLGQIEDLDLRQMAKLSLARGQQSASAPARVLLSKEQLVESLQKLSPQARVAAVSKWLIDEIKDILGQAAEEIDLDQIDSATAFIEIGLDSLLVTELQRRIQEKLQFRFKAMQGLDYQSIETLAQYLVDHVLFAEATMVPAQPVASETAQPAASEAAPVVERTS